MKMDERAAQSRTRSRLRLARVGPRWGPEKAGRRAGSP